MIDDTIRNIVREHESLKKDFSTTRTKEVPGNFTAGSVLFAGSNGIAAQNNANFFWDNANTRLRIGSALTTLTTYKLLGAKYSDTDAATLNYGLALEFTAAPGSTQLSAAKRAFYVIQEQTGSGGSSASGVQQGIVADVRFSQTAGTSSAAIDECIIGILRITDAATLGEGRGFRAIPIISSTGSLTTWKGLMADSPSVSGGGGITTAYGLYIGKQNVTGVTTGYGIYQADSADLNLLTGFLTASNAATVSITDAGTNTVIDPIQLLRSTSSSLASVAAGFGLNLRMNLDSTTTVGRNGSVLQTTWVTATDASRKARLTIHAYDTVAREGVRIEASGTAPMIGFLGAAAVVRQTVAAAAPAGGVGTAAGGYDTAAHRDSLITLVNDMRTAGINLGLWA